MTARTPDAGAAARRASSSGPWAVACLALSMLLASLGVSVANVALPTLAEVFSAPLTTVQWVVIAYLLAITVLTVSVGRLGDLFGRRLVMLGGIAVFAAATGLCGLAPTLPALIAARALQGIGAAILMSLAVAFVREAVTAARTGSAMGLLGTMSAIGTALGPSLGGALIAGAGWRAVFLVIVPVALLNFLLALRFLPASPSQEQNEARRFDRLGTLLLCLTLSAYALAMTVGGRTFGPEGMALLVAAAVGAALFVLVEARVSAPLIDLSLFANAPLSASLVNNALVSTVMMATLVVGPFYLALALGLTDWQVGLVMSVGPATSALTGVPSGVLVDRFGAPVILVVGLAAMAVGAVGLALLPEAVGVAGYIAALIVLTPGYQLFQAANNTAVMLEVGKGERGVMAGVLTLSRNLGLITGASVMGAVFAMASGTNDVAAAPASEVGFGMRMTFAIAGGLMLAALGTVLASRVASHRRKRAASGCAAAGRTAVVRNPRRAVRQPRDQNRRPSDKEGPGAPKSAP